ncbi:hypothetical protein [Parasedimentitalea maritima]|uniref:hypothetical protein n=1 Tax=Parasedimentitalea maritima TaxID=2578117 RepID=UPI001FD83AF6|nr:hypothetical protein [Zongyanglinia marina]
MHSGKTRNVCLVCRSWARLYYSWAWRTLDCLGHRLYLTAMIPVLAQKIELQDRTRLRERFFGAARSVLARL